MVKTLNITGLACGILGALLLSLDSWRTGRHFSGGTLRLSDETPSCFWLWCWHAGVLLILLAFVLQFVAVLMT
jgi:hypothetical protein